MYEVEVKGYLDMVQNTSYNRQMETGQPHPHYYYCCCTTLNESIE